MFRNLAVIAGLAALLMALAACVSGERRVSELNQDNGPATPTIEKVIETVIVEKPVVRIQRVPETVIVEKPVIETRRVVETVVVERSMEGKVVKVVETVIVERPVTRVEKVIETVIVEKVVEGQSVVVHSQHTTQQEGFNAIGGSATVNDAAYDLTFFKHTGVNPFIDTEDDNLSTFAIDVDTASYTVARRFLMDGNMPDPDSVRVEEFVNYFDQDYEPPEEGAFAIHVDGSPSPFGGEKHWMMRVGLQGKTVAEDDRKDATLIFAIDVSGSMGREDRLGLVKRSLRLLVDQLRPTDEVGIVIYGSRGSVLLEPTDGGEKRSIMAAIDRLAPSGSTYVEEGLTLAYRLAAQQVQPGRITRVILLSDGVGNVGHTGSDSILRQIRSYVDQGVTLTTVGFGMGNYNDILMEQLANDGDGTYHYVDTLTEAQRVFVDNLVGTLQNIARDTKIQVEFNPEVVRSYRLLGYENRAVKDEQFRDDTVDAGEVGAGHNVTALYEMKLHDDAEGTLATVRVRYEDPDSGEVSEVESPFQRSQLAADFEDASPRFQLAAVVAEYAEILRESYWAQEGSLGKVAAEASRVLRLISEDSDVAEFSGLATRAERIESSVAAER